ncbi:DUF3999 family protein [Mucilaginibacter mali]|uniref:DUF3999 family protein n=1 Tax=Mucilaginibacter mali TaxID=2740462 RepID=A0A7D4QB45_9SPHI|nr:DUF3999 family protein [Mucilaginibacter mali]QKJ32371.1 DUF3999 family protein [Mucilaginibacter mali]
MKVPNKVLKLNLLFCLCAGSLAAQQAPFKYRADVAGVDSAGYYRINLSPELTARAKADLSDIRLAGTGGNFVAYVKNGDMPASGRPAFVNFPQVKTNSKPDTSTIFVAENPTGAPISHLWLKLKNTTASRRITLTGSDDLKQWFAISEDTGISPATAGDDKGVYQHQLQFPASNYRYLRVEIGNGKKSPLNIIKAGIYTYLPSVPRYVPLTGLSFKRADSPDHITHIYINFKEAYTVNKLHLPVSTKTYFHRAVNVYTNDTDHRWLSSKTLTGDDMYINLSVKAKSLDVQIVNNDDEPLAIDRVEASQSQDYIIARLEPKNAYYLLLGSDSVATPKYDLQFFVEKLSGPLPEVSHQLLVPNPAYQAIKAPPAKSYPYLLWLSVAVAVLVLLSLTIKMTREVAKKN